MYLVSQYVTKPKLAKFGYSGGDERQALHAELATFERQALSGGKFHGGGE